MDSHLTEKLIHACEQVRRCREIIDSKYLWYWWEKREELLRAGQYADAGVGVTSPPTLAAGQLADALTMVRMSRHHKACRCGSYQRHWCTPDEKRWCAQVDRLLEAVRPNRF